jgi:hypothetical protein
MFSTDCSPTQMLWVGPNVAFARTLRKIEGADGTSTALQDYDL